MGSGAGVIGSQVGVGITCPPLNSPLPTLNNRMIFFFPFVQKRWGL